VLQDWPQECLQPVTNTAGFDDIVSEVAQFVAQRLRFLNTLKITFLGLNDSLSSTREMEVISPQIYLAPLLDVRPIAWVQFMLQAELTKSHLKLRDNVAGFFGMGGKGNNSTESCRFVYEGTSNLT